MYGSFSCFNDKYILDLLPMMRKIQDAVLLTVLAGVILAGGGCSENFLSRNRSMRNAFGGDKLSPEEANGMLQSDDPDIRRNAITSCMTYPWGIREPYLEKYARLARPDHEPEPSVRSVAVQALGKAKAGGYEQVLIACLDDPDSGVRWDTALVLDSMPAESSVGKLQILAGNDKSADVRAASATALRHYRTDSVFRTLLRCLDDPDLAVRCNAHDALVDQTGRDLGMDARNWSRDRAGEETLPVKTVVHKKRQWWDWFGLFEHQTVQD